jgi:thymidylate synthase
VRILFAVQGRYGERIAANVRENGPREWATALLRLPACLPPVIDDPAAVLPATIPGADLLVSLHETAGAADLIPDIAKACGAAAVLAAVDDRAACPPGLENQVRKRLATLGIACAFPRPLCGFDGGPHPLLSAFAESFGRPRFAIGRDGDRIVSAAVLRDAPCGSARFVASILPGTRVAEAPDAGALRHHHHPCLASMEIDPDLSDTIMHLSGYIVRAAIASALKSPAPRDVSPDPDRST